MAEGLSAVARELRHGLRANAAGERGRSAQELAAVLAGQGIEGRTYPDVAAALAAVLEHAVPGDRVLVTGSFLTVAAARRCLLPAG